MTKPASASQSEEEEGGSGLERPRKKSRSTGGAEFNRATELFLIATRNRRAAVNPPFEPGRHERSQSPSAMAEREDNVYQAKLAEQAERYDGKS